MLLESAQSSVARFYQWDGSRWNELFIGLNTIHQEVGAVKLFHANWDVYRESVGGETSVGGRSLTLVDRRTLDPKKFFWKPASHLFFVKATAGVARVTVRVAAYVPPDVDELCKLSVNDRIVQMAIQVEEAIRSQIDVFLAPEYFYNLVPAERQRLRPSSEREYDAITNFMLTMSDNYRGITFILGTVIRETASSLFNEAHVYRDARLVGHRGLQPEIYRKHDLNYERLDLGHLETPEKTWKSGTHPMHDFTVTKPVSSRAVPIGCRLRICRDAELETDPAVNLVVISASALGWGRGVRIQGNTQYVLADLTDGIHHYGERASLLAGERGLRILETDLTLN